MEHCILDKQYNQCPHLGDNQECLADNIACGMRKKEKEPEVFSGGYRREPRWYEQLRKRD